MKVSAKIMTNLVNSMGDLIGLQQKNQEFMHAQLEANEFLSKRIKALETRVIMMQSQQHLINVVSNISRQQPMKEVFDE